jgi:hypothetical protein
VTENTDHDGCHWRASQLAKDVDEKGLGPPLTPHACRKDPALSLRASFRNTKANTRDPTTTVAVPPNPVQTLCCKAVNAPSSFLSGDKLLKRKSSRLGIEFSRKMDKLQVSVSAFQGEEKRDQRKK